MDRKCFVCGKPIPEGRQKPTCSLDCALTRIRESAEQLRNKSGPYYDKWLRNVRKAAKRAAARYRSAVVEI